MKKGRVNSKAKYTEEEIRSNRKFPGKNTALLALILAVQIGLIVLGIWYQPKPQDVIHQYNVTINPLKDGSLDIEYHLVWEALDESEELTWVELGMANENFFVYPESITANISTYSKDTYDDYSYLRLDFKDAYLGGDKIEFSFKVNQKDMLCKNEKGYFYEFVPGWFNAIQIEQYEFLWLINGGKDYVQRGKLDYGEYSKMTIQYGMDEFVGCQTIKYEPFDDAGAYNELQESKVAILILCCMGGALLSIAEVYIIDSYVSYGRGRGFLAAHGYYMHVYGRSNPHYIQARDRYMASHSKGGHGRSGGCACACACACAGGGRAGCSQKDTFSKKKSQKGGEIQ